MGNHGCYAELTKLLSKSKNGILCAHLNVNGLVAKLDEIRLLIHECKIDVLAITETHLGDNTTNDEIYIDDYLLARKDRKGKSDHWGGTVIYYKQDLNMYEIDIPDNNLEAIWMELIVKSQKLLIGCVYRPPKEKTFVSNFRKIAESFCHRSNILLLGDFNIDMSAENEPRQTRDFKQALYELNLSNIIKTHTRITNRSKSLIDLALSSDTDKVHHCGTYPLGLSDHDLIYVTIKINKERTPPKLIKVRNYRDINQLKLREDLEFTPWHLIDLFEDPDDCLWCWEYMLKDVIYEHIKTRKVKVRSNNQPWITGEIRKALNERYRLLQKARLTNKNSAEWTKYKKCKNHCTNLIRSAKANFWKNEFQSSDSPKKFWQTVKKFQGKAKKSTISTLKGTNGDLITEDRHKANELNNFFASVGHNLAQDLKAEQNSCLNSHIYRITQTLSNIELELEDFTKAFNSAVKPGKSAGIDEITAKDLKLNEKISKDGLFRVIINSIKYGTFPTKWKTAKVSCIFKKGSPKECSNYRPISLLCIPSKVAERFVCSQLENHLRTFNLQSEHQWGFKAQRSTEDLLLHMTESWHKALDEGKVIGVLFLDFKKAFDSISHEILLKKLSACGVSGNFYDYIASYLQERKQFTVVNNVNSEDRQLDYGVPQGSILGPKCFSINVDDMADHVECNIELYADDTTAYTINTTIDSVLSDLQSDLRKFDSYASRNSLTLHPDKCEVIIISKKKFIGPLPKLEVQGSDINIVKSSKCLGITIDEKLSWERHIENVCRSFRIKIKKLYRMRNMPK